MNEREREREKENEKEQLKGKLKFHLVEEKSGAKIKVIDEKVREFLASRTNFIICLQINRVQIE